MLQDEETLRGLFNQFDVDHCSYISQSELISVFSKFGQEITKWEIEIIMKEHGRKHKNKIDFEEFKLMLYDPIDNLVSTEDPFSNSQSLK